jgi:hypothetical protein
MLGKKFSSPTDTTTLTACCDKCKDLFTVWARWNNHRMYVEPQSRIKHRNGDSVDSYGFIPIPHEGFYHHCGGKLALYPDYILPLDRSGKRY